MSVTRPHCDRCDRCGWPLAQPGADGCRPEDCSMRPLPFPRSTCSGCGARFHDAYYQEEPGRDYRAERDAAYVERNRCVAGLAAMAIKLGGRAWLADHQDKPGEDWDPEWRTVVFIEGGTGQLSWHLHDSDVVHFLFLPRGKNEWDGHTSEEKYARIARLAKTQCSARHVFSKTEDWVCQLDGGHDGAHQWPNPADTLT